jgi:hypothetical protein
MREWDRNVLRKGIYMSKLDAARGKNSRPGRDKRIKCETPEPGDLPSITVVSPAEVAEMVLPENHILCVGGPHGGILLPLALLRCNSEYALIAGESYCFMRGSKRRADGFAVLFLQWMPSV